MAETPETGDTIASRFRRSTEAIASATELAQRSREAQLARHGTPDQVCRNPRSLRLSSLESSRAS